jgi:hypothetical protein
MKLLKKFSLISLETWKLDLMKINSCLVIDSRAMSHKMYFL